METLDNKYQIEQLVLDFGLVKLGGAEEIGRGSARINADLPESSDVLESGARHAVHHTTGKNCAG